MAKKLLKYYLIAVVLFAIGMSTVYAQAELNTLVTFKVENTTVPEALNKLADEHDLSLAFSDRFFSKSKRISLDFHEKPLSKLLQEILKGSDVGFKYQNQQIILFRKIRKLTNNTKYTINGYVEDAASGERLIGVNVYHKSSGKWATTNEYGFYSITLPSGNIDLAYSYLGCEEWVERITLNKSIRKDVALEAAATLAEVIVMPGVDSSKVETLASDGQLMPPNYTIISPSIGGESDILSLASSLPGVQTGADGFGGMYVRGGEAGQNLMLLDGVPIYNPSHLLGVFSVYNSEAIRSARLLKGQFPARYGGRVSSIFDVRTKEGNQNKWTSNIGLGLMSGKASVEGPLFKGKGGMLLAGRRTHSNYLVDQVFQSSLFGDVEDYIFRFYDVNAKIHYAVSERDRLFLSYYKGGDSFNNESEFVENSFDGGIFYKVEEETILDWGNEIAALRWNRIWGARLFSNTTFTYSDYQYQNTNLTSLEILGFDSEEVFSFTDNRTRIQDLAGKIDFDFIPNPSHVFRFGANFIAHDFTPYAEILEEDAPELIGIDSVGFDDLTNLHLERSFSAKEAALYIEDEYKWNEKWKLNTGLRLSSLFGKRGNFINLEPRISLNYTHSKQVALHASVTKMVQYLQQVSLNSLSLPDDIWLPASNKEAPLKSWLIETGLTTKLPKQFSFSLEAYYKQMSNLLAAEPGGVFINDDFSIDGIIVGKGQAYGLEMMLQKEGKTGGWISYTLARTERQFSKVNEGKQYNFRFDSRHSINAFFYHQFHPKWNLTINWVYNTANPKIELDDFSIYSDVIDNPTEPIDLSPLGGKNTSRGKAYHRMDVNLTYEFAANKTKHRFKIGAFNLYNRSNPAFYRKTITSTGDFSSEPVTLLNFTPSVYYQLRF